MGQTPEISGRQEDSNLPNLQKNKANKGQGFNFKFKSVSRG
jgi:hypothetical protein